VEVLGALALDDDGVRSDAQDRLDRQQVGPAEMLERRNEAPIGALALVPEAVQSGELGAPAAGGRPVP
jgi:hypothetical protein